MSRLDGGGGLPSASELRHQGCGRARVDPRRQVCQEEDEGQEAPNEGLGEQAQFSHGWVPLREVRVRDASTCLRYRQNRLP